MGAFSRLFIFSFSLVGFFALLFSLTPIQFFLASYDPTIGREKEIIEYFSMANVTAYNSTGSANMTYQYSSYHDSGHAFNASMPPGEFIEVWWSYSTVYFMKTLQLKHIREVWWGLEQLDWCKFKYLNGSYVVADVLGNAGALHYDLQRKELLNAWDPSFNGSAFYADCSHFSASIIFQFNETAYPHIGEAWDDGELGFSFTYSIDFESTAISAWTIMGQLLTFQNPDLGITGPGGIILNYMIAVPLWLCIGLLILFIALALVPFISGLND